MSSQLFDKSEWQRNRRREFAKQHGYSTAAHHATGGLRAAVLERDGNKCVKCGMTAIKHLEKWGRPITVDHRDKDRIHNVMDNLQTLCLKCHGRKDLIPRLRVQRVPSFKEQIIAKRSLGQTYQFIADELGFSIASIYKWCRRWGIEKKRGSVHA